MPLRLVVLKRQICGSIWLPSCTNHSRFIVGYGLHASRSTAPVLEALRAALTSYGRPEEVRTDNGSQYVKRVHEVFPAPWLAG